MSGHAEGWRNAQVLGLSHFRRGHQHCVDQLTQVRAFAFSLDDLTFIRRDARYALRNLHDSGAWLDSGVYTPPALASWAPWLTWGGQEQSYNSFTGDGAAQRVRFRTLLGSFITRYEGEPPHESSVWLPSPGLRASLGILGIQGGRWHRRYVSRSGTVVAVERDCPHTGFGFDHHYLVTSREGLMTYVEAEGLRPAWFVRVLREVTPALFMNDDVENEPRPTLVHRGRDTTWLLLNLPDSDQFEVIPIQDELENFQGR